MTTLIQKFIEDMQLRGLAGKTQTAYVNTVRDLAVHFGKSPDDTSEAELRTYFLYLKNGRKVAHNAFRVALSSIKLFYERTLQRQWNMFELVHPDKKSALPVVLSREEVGVFFTFYAFLSIGPASHPSTPVAYDSERRFTGRYPI